MKQLNNQLLLWIVLVMLSTSLPAQFAGGRSDGFSTRRTVQLTVDGVPPPFTSGKDDGFGRQGTTQTINSTNLKPLYAGGRNDGFDGRGGSFTVGGRSLLVLYGGGTDDGFDHTAASLTISGKDINVLYGGGTDDGFDFSGSSSSVSGFDFTAMFGGGRDDGFDVGAFAGVLPFPLALIAFDAFPEEDFVLLKWVTEDEVNPDFFTLEKTKDGRDFSFVGKTLASGFTEPGERAYYELKDDEPFSGTSFYRLQTTDFDGAISLSHLVEVQYSAATKWDFALYPNPNTGRHFSVQPKGLKSGEELQLQIIDAQGRLLRTEKVRSNEIHDKIRRR